MEELLNDVNDEMNRILDFDFENEDELNFFRENIQQYFDYSRNKASEDHLEYNSLDYVNLFLICYRSFYNNDNFDELKKMITDNQDILNEIMDNSSCVIKYDIDCLIEYAEKLNYSNKIKGLDDIIPIKFFKLLICLDSSLIEGTIFDNDKCIDTIKRVLIANYFEFEAKLKIENILNMMIDSNVMLILNSFLIFKKINEEQINKYIILVYESLYRNNNVAEIVKKINNYYSGLIVYHNKSLIRQNKVVGEYLYISKYLNKYLNSDLKIFNIDFNTLKNIDENILLKLYKNGFKINSLYCEELLDSRDNLFKENSVFFKGKLIDSGYDINKIEERKLNFLLKYGNIDNIINNIKYVKKLEYRLFDMYSDNGLYILVNTNIQILENLNNLILKRIITPSLLENYPQIFFDKDKISDVVGLYSTVINNINLIDINYNLESEKINDLLILDNSLLKANIDCLKKYSNKINVNILKNNHLLDYVDLFIELGLVDYLDDNINLIDNNSILFLQRIYIARLMDLNILKNEKINPMLLTGANFYIPDSKLNDYIINDTEKYLPENIRNLFEKNDRNIMADVDLNKLDDYIEDELTYKIGNTFISKNKIIRNYNCLKTNIDLTEEDKLFYSMIYGSILSKSQIEEIKSLIFMKEKQMIKNIKL